MSLVFLTLLLWGAILSLCIHVCLVAVSIPADWAHWTAFAILIAWSVVLGFYSAYHIASYTLSIVCRRFPQIPRVEKNNPKVAILYLCKDDFKEQSAVSCCLQRYRNFDVFILDDSEFANEQRIVTTFCLSREVPPQIRRRPSREGFKAGNLNAALSEIIGQYEYFCIVDADDVLPQNFVEELVAIAEADDSLGFVQAAHTQYGESAFAKRIGEGQRNHWNFYSPVRNRNGFQHFYGHGALFRSEAIREVGQIPEVVSEDLALALELRRHGYRGYYAQHVVCQEEVPSEAHRFIQRQKRILCGTLQCLRIYLLPFLRSKNVPWIEKADFLVAMSGVFLPLVLVGFLTVFHGFLLLSANSNPSLMEFILSKSETPQSPLSLPELKVLLVVILLSPLVYQLPNIQRLGWKALTQSANLLCIHVSIVLQTVFWILGSSLGRKLNFVPTGARSFSQRSGSMTCLVSCMGLGVFLLGLLLAGTSVLIFGLCMMIAPHLDSILRSRIGRIVAILPAVVLLVSILWVSSVSCMGIAYAGTNDH